MLWSAQADRGSQWHQQSLRQVSLQRPAWAFLLHSGSCPWGGVVASERMQAWIWGHCSWALRQLCSWQQRSVTYILMAAQGYNNSLWQQLNPFLKLRMKVVKVGWTGPLSPDLHLMSFDGAIRACAVSFSCKETRFFCICQLLKCCCGSHLVADVTDKCVCQVDLCLRLLHIIRGFPQAGISHGLFFPAMVKSFLLTSLKHEL